MNTLISLTPIAQRIYMLFILERHQINVYWVCFNNIKRGYLYRCLFHHRVAYFQVVSGDTEEKRLVRYPLKNTMSDYLYEISALGILYFIVQCLSEGKLSKCACQILLGTGIVRTRVFKCLQYHCCLFFFFMKYFQWYFGPRIFKYFIFYCELMVYFLQLVKVAR